MRKTNDTHLKVFAIIYGIAIVIICIWLLTSCNGCNKQPPAPVVNIPETIQATAKPVEDSLRQVIVVQNVKIDSLTAVAKRASIKKEVIRERVVEREVPTTDSGALLAYNDLRNDFDQYVVQSDQQASAQGESIISQEKIITAMQADIELQRSKFKELATAFTNLNDQYGQAIKDLKKSEKKLQRAKAFNKIFGIGTAAGVGLALVLIL